MSPSRPWRIPKTLISARWPRIRYPLRLGRPLNFLHEDDKAEWASHPRRGWEPGASDWIPVRSQLVAIREALCGMGRRLGCSLGGRSRFYSQDAPEEEVDPPSSPSVRLRHR